MEGEQSQPPARKRTAEYTFKDHEPARRQRFDNSKNMTSPQNQDEQRGARVHIQVARQPLASQAGDDPKPEDVTTDAATSGSNLVAFEAGLTARQDAFHRSTAEAGDPASGNVLTGTIAPDPDEPHFAGAQADERTTKYFGDTKIQPRHAARLDFEAGSTPTSTWSCRSPKTFPSG